ncbi:MAG TPA: HAD-IB family phosphatase [Candidatus Acidoferrum sp.]|nr:HAD-IB family phosphatase [Candidatus Acidoferrum sp.]
MKERKEVGERKEFNEVREHEGNIAAFFDLDGTLVSLPSLERRLFRTLRYRRAIPVKNYFLWLKEAMRLIPRGISAILQANKMYLRGVQILDERGEGDGDVSSWHKDGHQAEGQASAPPRRNPRLPVPTFFAHAIETVAWHANQGHEIVLMSGTLEPLARGAARVMEAELAARGITVTIRVFATRLEEMDGGWTGRVLGEAMFGKAKARAAKRLAEEMLLDLGRCYAYGDSLNDRWLMQTVGRPAAVNPSKDLAGIAQTRGWPVMRWSEEKTLTQRSQSTQSSQRRTGRLGGGVDGEAEKQVNRRELKERLMNPDATGEAASRSLQ